VTGPTGATGATGPTGPAVNLTGPITSVGAATSIASQTGTGTTFAMSASPTFTGTVTAAALTATGLVGLTLAADATARVRFGWASSGASRPSTLYSAMLETNSDNDGLGLFQENGKTVRILFGSPANNVSGYVSFFTSATAASRVLNLSANGSDSQITLLNNGNVGFGYTAPSEKLDIFGKIKLRGAGPDSGVSIIPTGFGYDPGGYRVLQIGAASGNESVAIGYNPSVNANGAFTGNGTEVIFRDGAKFITPNGTTDWYIPVLSLYSGRVGIGTGTPAVQFELSGSIGQKASGTTWSNPSDIRLKNVLGPADLQRCYDDIKNMPLMRYTLKSECFSPEQAADRSILGWIANDIQKVIPKAVTVQQFSMVKVEDGVEETEQTFYNEETSQTETRILTKPKYKQEVIEDCLTLDPDQVMKALYGTVQLLQQKIELLEDKLK
jgi:hypothetical protein